MLPETGLWGFIARVMGNSYRDTFTVRLGTSLLLAQYGLVGPVAAFVGTFVRGLIGLLFETSIFQIDLLLDAYREGQKIPEFERAAYEAYLKATSKLYTEEEKDAIRKQYLEILGKIVPVGNGPKP